MSTKNAAHGFETAMDKLSRAHSRWEVFNDFIDYAILMLRWWDIQPSHFAALEAKYKAKDEQVLMAMAYTGMAELADNKGCGFKDPFGDYYMAHFCNKKLGQFFTPDDVCELNAALLIGASMPDDTKVADTCCGSGRNLLAAAKINRKALFYGADIDLTCCKMTIVNFMLNTLSGEVAWMNSMTGVHWKSWHFSKVIDPTGFYRPYFIEAGPNETIFSTAKDYASQEEGAISPSLQNKKTTKCKQKTRQPSVTSKQTKEPYSQQTSYLTQMKLNFYF